MFEITEKELQAQVVQLATMLGWRKTFHVYDSRRSHSGWPDLALVRDRLVLTELKSVRGKLSDAQREWIRALLNANVETYVVRPQDFEDFGKVLGSRNFAGQAMGRLRQRTISELEA